jgi:hypothetical protein
MYCPIYTRARGNIVLYGFAAVLNSAFRGISQAGAWAQLRKIGTRKPAAAGQGRP